MRFFCQTVASCRILLLENVSNSSPMFHSSSRPSFCLVVTQEGVITMCQVLQTSSFVLLSIELENPSGFCLSCVWNRTLYQWTLFLEPTKQLLNNIQATNGWKWHLRRSGKDLLKMTNSRRVRWSIRTKDLSEWSLEKCSKRCEPGRFHRWSSAVFWALYLALF